MKNAQVREKRRLERINNKKANYENLLKEYNFNYYPNRTSMQEKAEVKDPNKVIYIKQEGPVDPYISVMKYLARKEEEFGD